MSIMDIFVLLLSVLSLIISISSYFQTQRESDKTRQVQLFMELYNRWSGSEFSVHWYEISKWDFQDFGEFLYKYGPEKDPTKYSHFSEIGKFYEGIGVLVENGYIETNLVRKLMGGHIISYWDKFGEKVIKPRRMLPGHASFYVNIEKLHDSLIEVESL